MSKALSLTQSKTALERACENSFLVLTVVRLANLLGGTARHGIDAARYVASAAFADGKKGLNNTSTAVVVEQLPSVAVQAEKPNAVPATGLPVQVGDYVASSRIFAVPLEAGPGVQIGRIWFYLYDDLKLIRRVFRIDDKQVQKIMGGKERFYMTDVPWDRATGERGIEEIQIQAAADVEKLVQERASKRAGSKAKAAKGSQAQAQMPIQIVKVEAALKPAVKPVDSSTGEQQASVQSAPAVRQAVVRPVEGQRYSGVIAEMGPVSRPGYRGAPPYQAFCLKLESGGVHVPLYGVELQRELLERDAAAGDTVEVTFMGTKPNNSGSGHTNLYRVEIVSKGIRQ